MKRIMLLVLLLAASGCIPHPSAQDDVNLRRDAYQRAVSCMPKDQKPALRFEDIHWQVVHDRIAFPTTDGNAFSTVGYYDAPDSTIWIAAGSQWSPQILAHEALHAVLGSPGHGDPFRRCHLMD